jgi:hypothetical protein
MLTFWLHTLVNRSITQRHSAVKDINGAKNFYEWMLIVDHNHHGCTAASRAADNRSLRSELLLFRAIYPLLQTLGGPPGVSLNVATSEAFITKSCVSHWMRLLESFGSTNVSPNMFIREKIGPSCESKISNFVVDQYREMRNCNQYPHPRRRYSEGEVCDSKEFYIRHLLINQRMYITGDVHRGRRGEPRMPIIRDVHEHQITCVIQDDYHWIWAVSRIIVLDISLEGLLRWDPSSPCYAACMPKRIGVAALGPWTKCIYSGKVIV